MVHIRPLASRLHLGERVYHCETNLIGIVIGELFRPEELTLVRWHDGQSTFEARHDLKAHTTVPQPPSVRGAECIRRRIACGILPVAPPDKRIVVAVAHWEPCDGCDELVAPGQEAYSLAYPALSRVVRLHVACHHLWEAECQRQSHRGSAEVTCPLCREPVSASQNVTFRADGRVEHVSCPIAPRKPLHALPAKRFTAGVACAACAMVIEPPESSLKDGTNLYHSQCLAERRRPIAGGASLLPWLIVGDQRAKG